MPEQIKNIKEKEIVPDEIRKELH